MGNSFKCLSQGHSDALPHRELNQGFATFRLLALRLYQLSYAATILTTVILDRVSSESLFKLMTFCLLFSNIIWIF